MAEEITQLGASEQMSVEQKTAKRSMKDTISAVVDIISSSDNVAEIKEKCLPMLKECMSSEEESVDEESMACDKKKKKSMMSVDEGENKDLTSLSQSIALNQKIMRTLRDIDAERSSLNEKVTALQAENVQLHNELTMFKQEKEDAKLAEFSRQIDSALEEYCSFFGISESSERELYKLQLSTFSKDMLDKTLQHIRQKKQSAVQEVVTFTKPSSELKEAEKVDKVETFQEKTWTAMKTPQDKTNYLFDKMVYVMRKNQN